jgi:hypothetical protein
MRNLAAFLISIAVAPGCASPKPVPTTNLTTDPSPSATSAPAAPATCIRDDRYWPRPSVPPVDPCPFAIAATRAGLAGLGLPITQIHLEPDVFRCKEYWRGFPPPGMELCMGGAPILPGTAIHGWVTFVGSPKVAAVDLWRVGTKPSGPWQVKLAAFAVPPAGWTIP